MKLLKNVLAGLLHPVGHGGWYKISASSLNAKIFQGK
jgi:hypothetical protein